MNDYQAITTEIKLLQSRYNREHDIIAGAPIVTWSDAQNAVISEMLLNKVIELNNRIIGLGERIVEIDERTQQPEPPARDEHQAIGFSLTANLADFIDHATMDLLCALTLWTHHYPNVDTIQSGFKAFQEISKETGDCTKCPCYQHCPICRLNE